MTPTVNGCPSRLHTDAQAAGNASPGPAAQRKAQTGDPA